jgi:peptidoglycan hydrolase-like protein with peptidoglycan-binding domain
VKTRKPRSSAEPPVRAPSPGRPATMAVPVRQVLQTPRPQPKLTVSRPDDASEREADQMADQVMRLPGPDADDRTDHRLAGDRTVPEPSAARLSALAGGGLPLTSGVREFFEPRFGRDLGDVRLHTDPAAGELARSLGARAFTLGRSIVFGPGEYAPGSAAGRHLIAHELTHVLQQTHRAPGGAGPPALRRFEARPHEAVEMEALTAPGAEGVLPLQRSTGGTAVQRAVQRLLGQPDSVIQRALSSPRFKDDPTLVDVEAGTRTLSPGDSGPPVRKIQHGIHDAGIRFAGHGTDGEYGDETTRRVRRFQSRERVTGDPTGEVGSGTMQALDALFPQVGRPATAGDPYSFAAMLQVLCPWNEAMVQDIRRHVRVTTVDTLEWADERFDGASWVADPTPGDAEAAGNRVTVATAGRTNEEVARTIYHEYQHVRSPFAYRTKSWAAEEQRAFEMETFWSIDRGLTADPSLTTTDPNTGEVAIDPTGVQDTVASYPGIGGPRPGEVLAKVGADRVRVRLPDGRVTVRRAVDGDTVPGRRVITNPQRIPQADWTC